MLLQLAIKNFRSFKGETVFSMVASKDDQHSDHTVAAPVKDHRVLRTAAIYGANAAGKSNLVKALAFIQNLIVNGTRGENAIPVDPFLIDPETAGKDSKFGFTIAANGIIYEYGIALNSRQITEEWLYVTKNVKEQPWFERKTSPEGKVTVEPFHDLARKGTKEYQRLEFIAEGTRPNQPFLTELGEKNVTEVKPLLYWFENVLTVITPASEYEALPLRTLTDKTFAKYLHGVMRLADIGISEIKAIKTEQDLEELVRGVPSAVKDQIRTNLTKGEQVVMEGKNLRGEKKKILLKSSSSGSITGEILQIKTVHIGPNGNAVEFEFGRESDGTQRLAHLAPAFFDASASPKVFFVDELDRSLHPLLTRMLVQLFLSLRGESQLAFTTHDTNLLDLELLRRDEIWFMEKDREQSTRLYSLVEYKPRTDLKLEKNYLQGRFGAIPYIGDVSRLGQDVTGAGGGAGS